MRVETLPRTPTNLSSFHSATVPSACSKGPQTWRLSLLLSCMSKFRGSSNFWKSKPGRTTRAFWLASGKALYFHAKSKPNQKQKRQAVARQKQRFRCNQAQSHRPMPLRTGAGMCMPGASTTFFTYCSCSARAKCLVATMALLTRLKAAARSARRLLTMVCFQSLLPAIPLSNLRNAREIDDTIPCPFSHLSFDFLQTYPQTACHFFASVRRIWNFSLEIKYGPYMEGKNTHCV